MGVALTIAVLMLCLIIRQQDKLIKEQRLKIEYCRSEDVNLYSKLYILYQTTLKEPSIDMNRDDYSIDELIDNIKEHIDWQDATIEKYQDLSKLGWK